MQICLLPTARSTPDQARVLDIDPSKFLDLVADADQCPSTYCVDAAAKLAAPGFVLAQYAAAARDKKHTSLAPESSTTLFAYDLDDMAAPAIVEARKLWAGLDVAVYPTWKHQEAEPRLRLLVRLSAAVSNTQINVFKRTYRAVAARLGLKVDTIAGSAANLYFFPQHGRHGGSPGVRWRFPGSALDLDGLDIDISETERTPVVGNIGAVGARPDRGELKALSVKLRKRRSDHAKGVGAALAAVVRSESYAEAGRVYEVTQHLAFALANEISDLDVDWFRETWMSPCWRVMWPGEGLERIETDWDNAWSSATAKLEQLAEERAEERAALRGNAESGLDESQLDRVKAHAGALIVVHGSAYYVYDPKVGAYSNPVKAGLPARARELLGGVPGVQITEPRDNGRPCAKGAVQLIMDYGCAIDQVHYWAIPPAGPTYTKDQGGSIKINAYRWNTFPAVEHAICDDLWRSMAGDAYPTFEAWLTKFRDLSRPLPALTLVGPPGTWKSQTAQTLSRFWGDPDASTACRAQQVLGRFSGPLLHNPVVWSDEQLAVDDRGREQPERYRESISEIAHQVERKGIDPAVLHSALRHVIAVNDVQKVFSEEVHGDAVKATLDRYMVVDVDGDRVAAFEQKWAGTPELRRLREGTTMLEHVMWLETERACADVGRFGVEVHTDPDVLLRATFANELLETVLMVVTDAILAEAGMSQPGSSIERTPLSVRTGRLRVSPKRVVGLWATSKVTQGWRGSVPTPHKVSRMLAAAGFRRPEEGLSKSDIKRWGWPVDETQYMHWLRLGEVYDPVEVVTAMKQVWS